MGDNLIFLQGINHIHTTHQPNPTQSNSVSTISLLLLDIIYMALERRVTKYPLFQDCYGGKTNSGVHFDDFSGSCDARRPV